MSYEMYIVQERTPCPCGRGEILYGTLMNDWNQTRDGSELSCLYCEGKELFSEDFPDYSPEDEEKESLYKWYACNGRSKKYEYESSYPDYQGDVNVKEKLDCAKSQYDALKHRYNHFIYVEADKIETTFLLGNAGLWGASENPNSIIDVIRFCGRLVLKYGKADLEAVKATMITVKRADRLRNDTQADHIIALHKRYFKSCRLTRIEKLIDRSLFYYDEYKISYKEIAERKEEIARPIRESIRTSKQDIENLKRQYYNTEYENYMKKRKQDVLQYLLTQCRKDNAAK